jgi:hypothetical protein
MKVSIGNYKNKGDRSIKIHIDKWDTWSMDHTLAMIALPMLEQLKETNHGSAMVDLEDVPEELRYTTFNNWDSQKCFDFYNEDDKECMLHERWNWVMDEMIFAMRAIAKDNDSQFFDHSAVNEKDSFEDQIKAIKCDYDALNAHHDRVQNGCKLFGKYFQNLWD